MAFKLTKLEKVLATAVGLDIARPGTSRAAFTRAAQAAVAVVPRVAPPVARGAVGVGRAALGAGATLARRNPVAATGLGALALQQAGAFDPVEDAIQAEVERRTAQVMAPFEAIQRSDVQTIAKAKAKRKVSKYGKAIKAGMAAVKKSKFGGKKGTISNAKTTFGTVNKTISMLKKGRKAPKSGIRGTIARSVKRFL